MQSAAVFLAMTIGTIAFQNCGTYQPNEDAESASTAQQRLCTGSNCLVTPEGIQLSIGNPAPVMLWKDGVRKETAIDIGGYCDSGGYPDNRIAWRLVDSNNTNLSVAASGPSDVIKCSALGRYQFRVPIPGSYDYTKRHLLLVTLVGLDATGQSVLNPLNGHQKSIYFDTVVTP